jgi:hypothetical protein
MYKYFSRAARRRSGAQSTKAKVYPNKHLSKNKKSCCHKTLLSNLEDGSLTGSPPTRSSSRRSKEWLEFLVPLDLRLDDLVGEENQEQATLLRMYNYFSGATRHRSGAQGTYAKVLRQQLFKERRPTQTKRYYQTWRTVASPALRAPDGRG